MKKEYLSPTVDVVEIHVSQQLLMGSPLIDGDLGGGGGGDGTPSGGGEPRAPELNFLEMEMLLFD
jgi:hypothetical protein